MRRLLVMILAALILGAVEPSTVQIASAQPPSSIVQLLCEMIVDSATINDVFWIGKPGGFGAIAGSCFLDTPGQLLLKLKSWDNKDFSVPIAVTQWQDGYIQGTIPGDVQWVRNQTAKLQVVTADGRTSNERDLLFNARSDLQPVPSWTMQIYCAQAATWNVCNGIGTYGFCTPIPYPGEGLITPGETFGFHNEDCWATGDTDTDSYTVTFNKESGWSFASIDFSKYASGVWDWVLDPTVTVSPDSVMVSIRWHTDNGGPVGYSLTIWGFGPVGTPPI